MTKLPRRIAERKINKQICFNLLLLFFLNNLFFYILERKNPNIMYSKKSNLKAAVLV